MQLPTLAESFSPVTFAKEYQRFISETHKNLTYDKINDELIFNINSTHFPSNDLI